MNGGYEIDAETAVSSHAQLQAQAKLCYLILRLPKFRMIVFDDSKKLYLQERRSTGR